jgi:hypothetical protein
LDDVNGVGLVVANEEDGNDRKSLECRLILEFHLILNQLDDKQAKISSSSRN